MTDLRRGTATIDVVLPAFNAEATIGQAVRSLQDQTFRDFRILVVNDGSTDQTAALVSGMAKCDPRIVLLSKPNSGIVDALNMGLAFAKADFVARFDADDVAFPERFHAQLAHLRAHPDCVAVSSNAYHIDADGQRTGVTTSFAEVDADPRWAPSREPYLMHPFLLARREALVAVGGYRHVFHAEDVDLYWRLQDLGELANLAHIHGEYRVHEGSISSRSIINGRVLALYSQLASLSELRRKTGQVDIVFHRDHLSELQAVKSLDRMIDHVSNGLTSDERAYLELAASAKLLESSRYRPFELTVQDCAYIAQAIRRHCGRVVAGNQKELVFRQVQAARRLITSGRWREASALTPLRLYPKVLAYQVRLKTGRAWGNSD